MGFIMKVLFSLILSIILCTSIFAQEITNDSKYALSFGIGSNLTLNSFNMDIAAKKVFSSGNQLRLFLSPRFESRNTEDELGVSIYTTEIESNNYSIGLGADYLWTLLRNEDISMYAGPGLVFRYGKTDNKSTSETFEGYIRKDEQKQRYNEFGIRGALGVEWKVTKKIGIHSEYILTSLFQASKSESTVEDNRPNTVSEPVTRKTASLFLNSGVLFGLSVYL